MDSKRLVVLILVVLAILCAMALGAGVYQGRRDRTPTGEMSSGFAATLNRWFMPDHTTLDSARLKPVAGCLASGRARGATIAVRFPACDIVIGPGSHARPQVLRIAPPGSPDSYACFRLSAADSAQCPPGTTADSFRFKDAVSFSVGRDAAFLRLYCSGAPTIPCVFTLK